MKSNSIKFTLILITAAILISGCAGRSGSIATGWPGLTADENTVYMADGQYVYAINLKDGTQKWWFPVGNRSPIFYAAPTLTQDGQLIVGGYDNTLYSLDPTNGTERWSYLDAQDRYIGPSLAVEQGIFAPNADTNLYALDNQGKFLWSFSTQGPLWAKPITDANCKCIFLASMDHTVYSIDSKTSRINWQTGELGGSVVGAPALSSDGVLYIGTFNNEVIALNAENGEILWKFPTSDWVFGAPVLKNDRLYFGVLDGNFYALNAKNGEKLWGPFQADASIPDSPLVTDEAIYFTTTNGSVYALNLDGTKVPWSANPKPMEGKLAAAPLQAGEYILIAQTGADKSLIALDENGIEKWSFVPDTKEQK